jgi:serine/threonine-protein kinase
MDEMGAGPKAGGEPDNVTVGKRGGKGVAAGGAGTGRADIIDRYVILDVLGEGGMGVVYRAYDPDLDRRVALKCVLPQREGEEGANKGRERLLREAQALAQLSHPNVVAIYDVGTVGERVFIAMELVEGATVKQWLREQPRSQAQIVSVFLEAGEGLAAAHRAGLVHRDFKPDNVIIGADGRVRVIDFGLARTPVPATGVAPSGEMPVSQPAKTPPDDGSPRRPVEVSPAQPARKATPPAISSEPWESGGHLWSTPLTQAGAVVGTPPYMAPEQFRGGEVDAFTDQFSYAVSLYEALFGKRPFQGSSYEALREVILAGAVQEPAGARVPSWLRRIVGRGLSLAREARYPTMDALLDELRRDPSVRRRRAAWAVGLGCLLVAASFGLTRLSERRQAICRGFDQKLVGVWDDSLKQRVKAAFHASGRSYADDTFQRVEKILDAYTSGWVSMRQESCVATHVRGEQSPELLDLRMGCLDRGMTELSALTRAFAESSSAETVNRAVNAVTSLASLEECADAQALRQAYPPPHDPKVALAVKQLREQVARSDALGKTGKYSEGLELATRSVDAARRLDYPPVLAEALESLVDLQSSLSDQSKKETPLRELLGVAALAHDDKRLASAWSQLLWRAKSPEELQALRLPAETAVRRAGNTPPEQARFLNSLGVALSMLGRYQEEREAYERALERLGSSPDDISQLAPLHNNLGSACFNLGDLECAIGHFQQALALWTKLKGPDHPDTVNTEGNLANALSGMGRYEEAWPLVAHDLRVLESAYEPEHGDIGNKLLIRAILLRLRGDYDGARRDLERAVSIYEKVFGADDGFYTSEAYDALGSILASLGKYAEARRFIERGMAIRKKQKLPDHARSCASMSLLLRLQHRYAEARVWAERARPTYEQVANTKYGAALSLLNLARCDLGLGQAGRAGDEAEKALAMLEGMQRNPFDLAEAQSVLGQALWSSNKDRGRALALATQARDKLRTSEYTFEALRDVESWLTQHATLARP